MNNLLVATFGFFSIVTGFLGNFVFNLGVQFQEIFIFIGFVLCVIFTNITFYKHKKKIRNFILIIVIILGIIQNIFFFLVPLWEQRTISYYIRVALDTPYTILVFNWLAWSSYSAYKVIKNHNIEPWIKIRYKLITIFSFIGSLHNIPEFFQPKGVVWGDPSNFVSLMVFGVSAIIGVIFSIGFAFALMMPKKIKEYLNKDFRISEDIDISEKDLLEQIKNDLFKTNQKSEER